MRCTPFSGTKWPIYPEQKIFGYKPLLLLSSMYWPLSLWKSFKNSYSRSRIMTMHHFLAKNGPIVPNELFSENYFYHSHLAISPFHCAKLKKNLWAQNDPFPKMIIFFRKPVNEPCFFYSYLSICEKSKSDTNLLVKYWWLKNTEISLTESYFCL